MSSGRETLELIIYVWKNSRQIRDDAPNQWRTHFHKILLQRWGLKWQKWLHSDPKTRIRCHKRPNNDRQNHPKSYLGHPKMPKWTPSEPPGLDRMPKWSPKAPPNLKMTPKWSPRTSKPQIGTKIVAQGAFQASELCQSGRPRGFQTSRLTQKTVEKYIKQRTSRNKQCHKPKDPMNRPGGMRGAVK